MKLICTAQWRHENYEGLQQLLKDPENDIVVVSKSIFINHTFDYMIITDEDIKKVREQAKALDIILRGMSNIIQKSNEMDNTGQ